MEKYAREKKLFHFFSFSYKRRLFCVYPRKCFWMNFHFPENIFAWIFLVFYEGTLRDREDRHFSRLICLWCNLTAWKPLKGQFGRNCETSNFHNLKTLRDTQHFHFAFRKVFAGEQELVFSTEYITIVIMPFWTENFLFRSLFSLIHTSPSWNGRCWRWILRAFSGLFSKKRLGLVRP